MSVSVVLYNVEERRIMLLSIESQVVCVWG